jgi:hypothetical protein
MAEEADIARAIHTLSATLNERSLGHFDEAQIQQIVSGALGGEHRLTAHAAGATSGELRDEAGARVAKLDYADGVWTIERVPQARDSEPLQRYEQQRSEDVATEYQKPVRGRIAIWKKRLTGN